MKMMRTLFAALVLLGLAESNLEQLIAREFAKMSEDFSKRLVGIVEQSNRPSRSLLEGDQDALGQCLTTQVLENSEKLSQTVSKEDYDTLLARVQALEQEEDCECGGNPNGVHGGPTRICFGKIEKDAWTNYSGDEGIQQNVSFKHCGFKTAPTVLSSLSGTSSHWQAKGMTSPYNVTPDGCTYYINSGGLRIEFANENSWTLNWVAFEQNTDPLLPAPTIVGSPKRMCTGEIPDSSWSDYGDETASGIQADVSFAHCGFTGVPTVISSLVGDSSHWQVTGIESPYNVTPQSARYYLHYAGLKTTNADLHNYTLKWIAFEENAALDNTPIEGGPSKMCFGSIPASSWTNYDGTEGIQADASFAHCDFAGAPVIMASLEGKSSHWTITGMNSVYNLNQDGARYYLHQAGLRIEQAVENGYILNWAAFEM